MSLSVFNANRDINVALNNNEPPPLSLPPIFDVAAPTPSTTPPLPYRTVATANELRYLLHWGTYNELLLAAARTQHRVEPVMNYAIGLVRERHLLQQQTAQVRSHLASLNSLLQFTEERIDSATAFMASCDLRLEGHLLVPLSRYYNIELANIPTTVHPSESDDDDPNHDPNTTVPPYVFQLPDFLQRPSVPPAVVHIRGPSPAPSVPSANPISNESSSTQSSPSSRSSSLPVIATIKQEPTPESDTEYKLEYPDDTITIDNDGVCRRVSVGPVFSKLGRNSSSPDTSNGPRDSGPFRETSSSPRPNDSYDASAESSSSPPRIGQNTQTRGHVLAQTPYPHRRDPRHITPTE
ncbi:hypothetical protein MPER_12006 [Moniliophthora perniciosa FA553]|nr:hypothetical protein MPER_12006 [Moniliophthora perniciosa FA553]